MKMSNEPQVRNVSKVYPCVGNVKIVYFPDYILYIGVAQPPHPVHDCTSSCVYLTTNFLSPYT